MVYKVYLNKMLISTSAHDNRSIIISQNLHILSFLAFPYLRYFPLFHLVLLFSLWDVLTVPLNHHLLLPKGRGFDFNKSIFHLCICYSWYMSLKEDKSWWWSLLDCLIPSISSVSTDNCDSSEVLRQYLNKASELVAKSHTSPFSLWILFTCTWAWTTPITVKSILLSFDY